MRSFEDSNLELGLLLDILYWYHASATCINHESSKTLDDDCIFDPCNRELLTSVRLWLMYYRFADYFASVFDASDLLKIRILSWAFCLIFCVSIMLQRPALTMKQARHSMMIVSLTLATESCAQVNVFCS
jgi:hypothetical protein